MKLFFDADIGTGVPMALRELEIIDCLYMQKVFRSSKRRPGHAAQHTKDEIWIPQAGRHGWFVISCNKAILDNEAQRQLWIDYKVGGLFLTTGQEKKYEVFKLMVRKLEWMRLLDAIEERPFAYLMPLSGRPTKVLGA